MKKIPILLLMLAAMGCVSAQKMKTVKAEGPVVKDERKMDKFTGVKTSAGIDVFLTQGNAKPIVVEAEESLQEYILTEVKDGVLNIYTKVKIKDSKGMKVYVSTKNIAYLSASSAGDIIAENTIQGDELNLKVSSSGDIHVKVDVKKLSARSSSSGDIILAGMADFIDAKASSSGDVKAKDLKAREAEANASSSGSITLNVSEMLSANVSSSGDVWYYGDPKVKKHESSGGRVGKK